MSEEEGRPSRWKDGLTRSFAHGNRPQLQCLMPRKISSSDGTDTGRSKRLAKGTLGPSGPGVKRLSCRAPMNDAEESRLA